ncbi:MAG TPA: hypothetical protein VM364_21325 [Vicinamibacterales bacterium]|nr:hypothetical protein [Vicinamibacterales bacterium]
MHYDSPEEACVAAFAGGPVALAYSRFDDGTREAAHAEYLASIAPGARGSGTPFPASSSVARGTRAGSVRSATIEQAI